MEAKLKAKHAGIGHISRNPDFCILVSMSNEDLQYLSGAALEHVEVTLSQISLLTIFLHIPIEKIQACQKIYRVKSVLDVHLSLIDRLQRVR